MPYIQLAVHSVRMFFAFLEICIVLGAAVSKLIPVQAASDQVAMDIRGMSPVHVNLFDTFEFSPAVSKIDIDTLVARYADSTY